MKNTGYWSHNRSHKTCGTMTIKKQTKDVALSPITPDYKADRKPLMPLDPNSASNAKQPFTQKKLSSTPSSTISVKKENTAPSVRERLLMRKSRAIKSPLPELDSGVIDLTGSDDEDKVANANPVETTSSTDPVSDSISITGAPFSNSDLVPWKIGPAPPLIWSTRTANGAPIKTYSQLKAFVKANTVPVPAPTTSTSSPVSVCPNLYDFVPTDTLPRAISPLPKLPKLTLPKSQPGTSGLAGVAPSSSEPVSITDLMSDDDDDDTPLATLLTSLTPSRPITYAKRTGAASTRLPSTPANVADPSSRTKTPDPSERVPSQRQKRKHPC